MYGFGVEMAMKSIFPGIIQDFPTGADFKANSGLTIDELLALANKAKSMNMLNSVVTWREAALQVAKDERKSEALMSKIEKMVNAGKKHHDKVSHNVGGLVDG